MQYVYLSHNLLWSFFGDFCSDSGFQKINISKRMADEEKNGMSMGKEVEI